MSNPSNFPDLTNIRAQRSRYADYLIQLEAVNAGAQPNLHVDNQEGAPTSEYWTGLLKGRVNTTFEEQQAILNQNPPPGQIPGEVPLVTIQLTSPFYQVTWLSVPYAVTYKIRIYESVNNQPFGTTIVQEGLVRIPTLQYITSTENLIEGRFYFASVQAQGTGGEGAESFTPVAVRYISPPAAPTSVTIAQTDNSLFTTWAAPPTGTAYAVEWYKAPIQRSGSTSFINSSIYTFLHERQYPVTRLFTSTSITPAENGAYYFARVISYNEQVQGSAAQTSNATIFWKYPSAISNLIINSYAQNNSIFVSFAASEFASAYKVTIFENSTINFSPLPSSIFEVQNFSTLNTPSYTILTNKPLSLKDNYYYFATATPYNNIITGDTAEAFTPFLYRRIRPSSVQGQYIQFSTELPPARIFSSWTRPSGNTSSFVTRYRITYYQNGQDMGPNIPTNPRANNAVVDTFINSDPLQISFTNTTPEAMFINSIYYYAVVAPYNNDSEGVIAVTPPVQYFAVPSSPQGRITQFGDQLGVTFEQVSYATDYTVQFYTNTASTLITDPRFVFGQYQLIQSTNTKYITALAPSRPTNGLFYYATVIANNSNVQGKETVTANFAQFSEVPGAPIVNIDFNFNAPSTDPIIQGYLVYLSNTDSYLVNFYSNATGSSEPSLSGLLETQTIPQGTVGFRDVIVCGNTISNGQSVFMTVQARNGTTPAINTAKTEVITFFREPPIIRNPSIILTPNTNLFLQWDAINPLPADTTVSGYRITVYDNGTTSNPVIRNTVFQMSTIADRFINNMVTSNDIENDHYYWADIQAYNGTKFGAPSTTQLVQYLVQVGQPIVTMTYTESLSTPTLVAGWINMDPAATGVSTFFYSQFSNNAPQLLSQTSSPPFPTYTVAPFGITFSNFVNYFATVIPYNRNVAGISATSPNITFFSKPTTPTLVTMNVSLDLYSLYGSWQPVYDGSEEWITGYDLELWLSTGFGFPDQLLESVSIEGQFVETAYTFLYGASNNYSYYFRVRNFNNVTKGDWTRSSNAVTYYTPPSSPTSVLTSLTQTSGIFTSWNPPDSFISGYELDVYVNTAPVSTLSNSGLVSTFKFIPANTPYYTANLQLSNGSNYFTAVRSVNFTVSSPTTVSQNAIIFWARPVPPNDFRIEMIGQSTLKTSWTPPLYASTYVIDFYASQQNQSTPSFFSGGPFETLSNVSGPPAYPSTTLLTDNRYYFAAMRVLNNTVSSVRGLTRNNVLYYQYPEPATLLNMSITNISSIFATWASPTGSIVTSYLVDFYESQEMTSSIGLGTFLERRVTSQNAVTASTFNLKPEYYYFAWITTVNRAVSSVTQTPPLNAAIYFSPPQPVTNVRVEIIADDLGQRPNVFFDFSPDATTYNARFYYKATPTSTLTGAILYQNVTGSTSNQIIAPTPIADALNGQYFFAQVTPVKFTAPGPVTTSRNTDLFNAAAGAPIVNPMRQLLQSAGQQAFSTSWVNSDLTKPVTGWSTNLYWLNAPPFGSTLIESVSFDSNTQNYITTSNLQDGQQYYFGVRAFNNNVRSGEGRSPLIRFYDIPDPPATGSLSIVQTNSSLTANFMNPGTTNFSSYVISLYNLGATPFPPVPFNLSPLQTVNVRSSITSFLFRGNFQNTCNYYFQIYTRNFTISSLTTTFPVPTVYYGVPGRSPPATAQITVDSNVSLSFATPTDFTSSFVTNYDIYIYNNGRNPFITPGYTVIESNIGGGVVSLPNTSIPVPYTTNTPLTSGNYYFAMMQFCNNSVQATASTTTNLARFIAQPTSPDEGSMQQVGSNLLATFPITSNQFTDLIDYYVILFYRINNTSPPAFKLPVPYPTPSEAQLLFTTNVINTPTLTSISSPLTIGLLNRAYYGAYAYSYVSMNQLSSFPPAGTGPFNSTSFQYLAIPSPPVNLFVSTVPYYDTLSGLITTTVAWNTPSDRTSSFGTSFRVSLYDNGFSSIRNLSNAVELASAVVSAQTPPLAGPFTYSNTFTLASLAPNKFLFHSVVIFNEGTANGLRVQSQSTILNVPVQYINNPQPPNDPFITQSNRSIVVAWSTPQDGTAGTLSNYTVRLFFNDNEFQTPTYTTLVATCNIRTFAPVRNFYSTVITPPLTFADKKYYFADITSVLSNGLSSLDRAVTIPMLQYLGKPNPVFRTGGSLASPLYPGIPGSFSTLTIFWSTANDYTSSFANEFVVQLYDNLSNGVTYSYANPLNPPYLLPIGSPSPVSKGYSTNITDITMSNGRYYFATIAAQNRGNAPNPIAADISTPTQNLVRYLATPAPPSNVGLTQVNSSFLLTFSTPTDGTTLTATSYVFNVYKADNQFDQNTGVFVVGGSYVVGNNTALPPGSGVSFLMPNPPLGGSIPSSEKNFLKDGGYYYVQGLTLNVTIYSDGPSISYWYNPLNVNNWRNTPFTATPQNPPIFTTSNVRGADSLSISVWFSSPTNYTSSYADEYKVQFYTNGFFRFVNTSVFTPEPVGAPVIVLANKNAVQSVPYAARFDEFVENGKYYFASIVATNRIGETTSVIQSALSTVTSNRPLARYFGAPQGPDNVIVTQAISSFRVSWTVPTDIWTTLDGFNVLFYNLGTDVGSYPPPSSSPLIPPSTVFVRYNSTILGPGSTISTFVSTTNAVAARFINNNYYAAGVATCNGGFTSVQSYNQDPTLFYAIPAAPSFTENFFDINNDLNVFFSSPTDFTSSAVQYYEVRFWDNGTNPTIPTNYLLTATSSAVLQVEGTTGITVLSYSAKLSDAPDPPVLVGNRYYFATVQSFNNQFSSLITRPLTPSRYVIKPGPLTNMQIDQTGCNIRVIFSTPNDESYAGTTYYNIILYSNSTSNFNPNSLQNIVTSTFVTTVPQEPSAGVSMQFSTLLTTTGYFTNQRWFYARGYAVAPPFIGEPIATTANITQYLTVPTNPTYAITALNATSPSETSTIYTIFSTTYNFTSSVITSYAVSFYNNGTNATIQPGANIIDQTSITVTPPTAVGQGYATSVSPTLLSNGNYYFAVIQSFNESLDGFIVSSPISTVTTPTRFFEIPGALRDFGITQIGRDILVSFSTPIDTAVNTTNNYTIKLWQTTFNNTFSGSEVPILITPTIIVANTGTPQRYTARFSTIQNSSNFINNYSPNGGTASFYYARGFATNGSLVGTTTPTSNATPYYTVPDIAINRSTGINPATSNIIAVFSTQTFPGLYSTIATGYAAYLFESATNSCNSVTPVDSTFQTVVVSPTSANSVGFLATFSNYGGAFLKNNFYYYAQIVMCNVNFSSPACNATNTLYLGPPAAPSNLSWSQQSNSSNTSSIVYRFQGLSDTTLATAQGYVVSLYSNASQTTVGATRLTGSFITNNFTSGFNYISSFNTPQLGGFSNGSWFFVTVNTCNGTFVSPSSFTNISTFWQIPGNARHPRMSTNETNVFVHWSSPIDFTSSIGQNYRVQIYETTSANQSTSGTLWEDNTQAIIGNATASLFYSYQSVSTPTNNRWYWGRVQAINNTVSSVLFNVTCNAIQYLGPPMAPSGRSLFRDNSSIMVFFSSPNDGSETTASGFSVQLFSNATQSYTGTAVASNFITRVNNNPNFPYAFRFSTPNAGGFSNRVFYYFIARTFNGAFVSDPAQGQSPFLQFYQVPGNPINVTINYLNFANSSNNYMSTTFGNAQDFTSSIANFSVIVYEFNPGGINPGSAPSFSGPGSAGWTVFNPITVLSNQIAGSAAVTCNIFIYNSNSYNLSNQRWYATAVKAHNNDASSILVTTTPRLFYYPFTTITNISSFQNSANITIQFSTPIQVYSTSQINFDFEVWSTTQVNVTGYPPPNGARVYLANFSNITAAPGTALTTSGTTFSNGHNYVPYVRGFNSNLISTGYFFTNGFTYLGTPANIPTMSSFFLSNTSNLYVLWSTGGTTNSSFYTRFVIKVFSSGGTTLTANSTYTLLCNGYSDTTTKSFSTIITLPELFNASKNNTQFWVTVQPFNLHVGSANPTEVGAIPFYHQMVSPGNVTMSYNAGVTVNWTYNGEGSNTVNRFRIWFIDNGTSSNTPPAVTSTPMSTIFDFSTTITLPPYDSLNNYSTIMPLFWPQANIGNFYYAAVQAFNVNEANFSSGFAVPGNMQKYVIVPSPPFSSYMMNLGALFANWTTPGDITSSGVDFYQVVIFSNNSPTIYNYTNPRTGSIASPVSSIAYSYAADFPPNVGSYYFATVRSCTNEGCNSAWVSTAIEFIIPIPAVMDGGNPMGNNRYYIMGPSNAAPTQARNPPASWTENTGTWVHFSSVTGTHSWTSHSFNNSTRSRYRLNSNGTESFDQYSQSDWSGMGGNALSYVSTQFAIQAPTGSVLNVNPNQGVVQWTTRDTLGDAGTGRINVNLSNWAIGWFPNNGGFVGGDGYFYYVPTSKNIGAGGSIWIIQPDNYGGAQFRAAYTITHGSITGFAPLGVTSVWTHNGLLIYRMSDYAGRVLVYGIRPNHKERFSTLAQTVVWSTTLTGTGNNFYAGYGPDDVQPGNHMLSAGDSLVYIMGQLGGLTNAGRTTYIYGLNPMNGNIVWQTTGPYQGDDFGQRHMQARPAITWGNQILIFGWGGSPTVVGQTPVVKYNALTGTTINTNGPPLTGSFAASLPAGFYRGAIVDRDNNVYYWIPTSNRGYTTCHRITGMNSGDWVVRYSSFVTISTVGNNGFSFGNTMDPNGRIWFAWGNQGRGTAPVPMFLF